MLINVYCTTRELPALDFPHEVISQRDHSDSTFRTHLDDFVGYILDGGKREMTQRLYFVMRHLQRTHHQMNIEVDDFDSEGFTEWVRQANGICFLADGTLRDPWGKLLVDTDDGSSDEKAEVPFPPDAYQRKATSDNWLRKAGILVPPTLPPVVGEKEVVLQSAEAVARRALALFVVALRAESIVSENELTTAHLKQKLPLAFEQLSPAESEFMEATSPEEQHVTHFISRYESLFLLQWALGMADELPMPTTPCNTPQVARVMLDTALRPEGQSPQLRPTIDILNALDLHYRLHWATRHSRLNDLETPAQMDDAITTERHYALNWLTQFEAAPWDEVDTPT